MKELQRELEDSRAAQKEVLASARESERRSKAMEADIIQLQEVRPRGDRPPAVIHKTVGYIWCCFIWEVFCVSRCWQQPRELGSRWRRKETSCLKNWPVTRLESGCPLPVMQEYSGTIFSSSISSVFCSLFSSLELQIDALR